MTGLNRETQERLLGRRLRSVMTDVNRRAFEGRRLLVTGAGGSVGSELAVQLAACSPESLALVDHAEYNLFRIESELRERHPGLTVVTFLGDVSRRADITAACRAVRPHAVFHAAAYKHVTMTERAIVAAARTNILGTANTVRAAHMVGSSVVLISSDKAAEPRSVMGATKRMAELVAFTAAGAASASVAVRFGNILGSSGSVVEIMLRCIQERRPIPITHEAATRFFMTAEEAVSLVLKASLVGRGGELFWLDMGAPLRIGDLARRVIEWATPPGESQVDIEIIGLRPGEKLREELTTQGLAMQPTQHPQIWAARQPQVDSVRMESALSALRRSVRCGDAAGTLDALVEAVPEFEPSAAAIAASGADERRVQPLRRSA